MKTIHLVSCVAQKHREPAAAKDLYISAWFKKARAYVQARGGPWFILSAEHGLLRPESVVGPYERTLNTMSVEDRRSWTDRVIAEMDSELGHADRLVVLAGIRYREFLMDYLVSRFGQVEVPMEGMRIGEQLRWLGTELSRIGAQ